MQDPNKFLKTAVDSIVNSINNDKLSPHDAVVKTAKEMELNVHFIKRACEVVNVALTYEHFRKHADARDADFPIVNAEKVSAEIFQPGEATLAEKKSEWFSGTMVDEQVPNYIKVKHDAVYNAERTKIASEQDIPNTTSAQGICEKAGMAQENMRQHLDNCRTEFVGARHELATKFANLVNTWSRDEASRISFSDFESQVFSKYGEESVSYLDLIHTSIGGKEARGEHDSKHIAFDDAPETLAFGEMLAVAGQLRETTTKLAEAASDLAEIETKRANAYRTLGEARLQELHADDVVEDIKVAEEKPLDIDAELDPVLAAANQKMAEFIQPFVEDEGKYLTAGQCCLPPKLKASIIASKKKIAELEVEKDAGALSGVYDTVMGQYKKQSTPAGVAVSSSPLDNLDRKLLLQHLMITDPILKTYDPKRVADVYEQFLRLAPELSLEKEIVRSQLRTGVAAQAVSAYDATQLVDTNTKLLKQKMLESGVKIKDEGK